MQLGLMQGVFHRAGITACSVDGVVTLCNDFGQLNLVPMVAKSRGIP